MKFLFYILCLFVFVSCSKKEEPEPPITIETTPKGLHFDDTYQFKLVQAGNQIDPSTFTWTSSNTNAGTISKKGLFSANKIGETTITAVSSDNRTTLTAKVTIVPYGGGWKEPYTAFGVTKSVIKSNETRNLLLDSEKGLFYDGEKSNVILVTYLFENNAMSAAVVNLETSTSMAKEASTFLVERYEYIGTKDGQYAFLDNKGLGISLTVDKTAGLVAVYFPFKKGGRLGVQEKSILFDEITRRSRKQISLLKKP